MFNRRSALAMGLWIAGCCSITPATFAADPVTDAARRGTAMFWYDRAAWVTSDDLQAKLPRNRMGEIGGWIVVPGAERYHVYYHGKSDAADAIIYEADVVGNTVSDAKVHPKNEGAKLPASAMRLAKALSAARAEMDKHADWRSCAPATFNTVVLPVDDGSIAVYFLTPQVKTDAFPFGGHYLVMIGPGGEVSSTRSFTTGCLTLPKPPSKDGKAPEGLIVSHILDPQPTEVHVFEQFGLGIPLYVVVNEPRAAWKVANGAIEKVMTRP